MDHSDDIIEVLKADGVDLSDLKTFVNKSQVSLNEVISKYGEHKSWATRVVYNDRFGAVLIKQFPGEGNRLHYHPDSDECWVILEGEWEWFIEGEGTKVVKKNDIVIVQKNTKHKITCRGDKPGIRLAITKPDVDHVYEE